MILRVLPKFFAGATLGIATVAGTINCNNAGNSVDNIQTRDTFETTAKQDNKINVEEYGKTCNLQAKGISDMFLEMSAR